jgi:pimeloyl-ACP methyl ester carboxylesterase
MDTVRSPDGTKIAFDAHGAGPLIILVDGALTVRSSGSELARLLAPRFTVVGFDRRGRGSSGDTPPYAIDREIDDIEALIDRFGDPAFLYGHSSGGPLAMLAAIRLGSKVGKVAMYEPPYNNEPAAQLPWGQYLTSLREALREGRRGDAVALFLSYVGTPSGQLDAMRRRPSWPDLEAVAPTLSYDHAGVMGESLAIPTELASRVTVPTLVMAGDAGLPFMADTARLLGQFIPRGQVQILTRQTHRVAPEVLAPVLIRFFTENDRDRDVR